MQWVIGSHSIVDWLEQLQSGDNWKYQEWQYSTLKRE